MVALPTLIVMKFISSSPFSAWVCFLADLSLSPQRHWLGYSYIIGSVNKIRAIHIPILATSASKKTSRNYFRCETVDGPSYRWGRRVCGCSVGTGAVTGFHCRRMRRGRLYDWMAGMPYSIEQS